MHLAVVPVFWQTFNTSHLFSKRLKISDNTAIFNITELKDIMLRYLKVQLWSRTLWWKPAFILVIKFIRYIISATSFFPWQDGVVFVLSGFENPERGNLRDQALTMGAKYEPGWNNRCTHLMWVVWVLDILEWLKYITDVKHDLFKHTKAGKSIKIKHN